MTYKFLEHTADIKILVEEPGLEQAFKSSALALKEIILDFEKINIKPEQSRFISVEGRDLGDLLYSFIEEFIYMLDADSFMLSEIEELSINEENEEKEGKETKKFVLSAHVLGDKAGNYKIVNKVKAITFNEMLVKKEKQGKKESFKIEFVLDV